MATFVSDAVQPSPVTIETLARDGGQTISTLQSGGTRTLLLTQPSIVRVHATSQSVVRYERQGDDLILHLQDGSTVICKNYFLEAQGQTSELVFDDGTSVAHATFPTAGEGVVTPQFEVLPNIEPLLISHSHTMTYLTSALGALALGGIAAAAGSGGGGGGGDGDSNPTPQPPAPEPPTPAGVLTPGVIAGDNALNAAEAASGFVISGTSANLKPGSLVTITLGDKTYTAPVQQNGDWQVTISPEDAQALADGTLPVIVSATDESGKTVTAESSLLVITHTLPAPTIDTAFGDNLLNLAESQTAQPLTGSTGVSGAGQTVLVSLNGTTYTATVDNDGRWSLTLPPEVLSQLAQGGLAVSVTATDAAGNSGGNSASLLVDTLPPPVTVTALTNDNLLNLVETRLPIDVTGTAEPGAQVVVSYNNQSWSATADGEGNWLVTIPADTLSEMANGLYPLTVSATDAAGNRAAVSETITMALTPPEPTLNTPFGDGALNSAEVQQPQLLTGTSGAFGDSQQVLVNIGGFNVREHTSSLLGSDGRWQLVVDVAAGGNNYIATVDANGNWVLELPPDVLQQLNNGEVSITVVAADGAGNLGAAPQAEFEVDTTPPELTINPVTGDDILNAAESQSDLLLSGGSIDLESGQPVTVTFNGVVYNTTVDASGNWSVTVPNAALASLPQGVMEIVLATQDVAGNASSLNHVITVDTELSLSFNPVAGDDIINAVESNSPITISGAASADAAGRTVTLTLNGVNYTASVLSDGTWSTVVPAEDLAGLTDGVYTINATLSDLAGNTLTVPHSFTLDADPSTLPTLTLNPVSGDNIINAAEAGLPLLLSGTTTNVEAGQIVTLNVAGTTFTAVVGADGGWSVEVPAAIVSALGQGEQTISAQVSDTSGNPGVAARSFLVDTEVTLTVNPVAGDDIINAAEAGAGVAVSGTANPADAGLTVIVALNGVNYSATVQADGTWSTTIPAADLAALADGAYTLNASLTDAAGNSTTVPRSVTLDAAAATLPTLTIAPLSGDGYLNAAEAASPLLLSGVTTNVEAGRTVTLTLNGITYSATVQADGSWSVEVPVADLDTIADGLQTVQGSVTDASGNPATASGDITLITDAASLPVLTVNAVTADDVINASEAGAGVTLSGASVNLQPGQPVSVVLNGITYSATVGAGGSWSVNIPAADAQALAQGNVPFTVSSVDIAGNPAQLNDSLTVDTEVTLTVNPVAGDDIINAAEAGAGVAVSGTANPADAGLTVTLALNGVIYSATVQADGTWSTTISAADLAVLADGAYTLNASLTDAAGNSTTVPRSVTLDAAAATLPVLFINAVSGDNYINGSEISQPLTLSGTATNVEEGQTVTLDFAGNSLSAVVGADGTWSVEVPAIIISALGPGLYAVTGQVSDASGNPSSATGEFIVDTTISLTIDAVATDDIINAAEAGAGVAVSGTASDTDVGQTVTVTLNGVNYSATVQADGTWSTTIPAADLAALADGPYTINASLTDMAGNSTTVPRSVTLDAAAATLPTLTIAPLSGDGYLNAAEAASPLLLSGVTTNVEAGRTVTLTLNGITYSATVQADGSWSVEVPVADLDAVADGLQTVQGSVTDAAGNPATASSDVTLITDAASLPVLTVNAVTADDVINASEAGAGVTLSGASVNLQPGQPVSVVLNGITYSATVGAGGSWSVNIPAADAQALAQGSVPFTVSSTDIAGNPAQLNDSLTVDTQVTLTVNPVAGDDIINAAEAGAGVAVSGTANPADAGLTVTLALNGVIYSATVQADGTWSTTVPAADLAVLADGAYTLNASLTDAAGNSTTVPRSVTLDAAAATLPTLTIAPLSGDGYLNAAEAASPLLLSGVTTNVEAGRTVTLTLNGITYSAAVQADGSWSVEVPVADLDAVADGLQTVQGSVTDAAGNPATASGDITLITDAASLPVLTVNAVTADDVINASEAGAGVTLSGASVNLQPGQPVSVVLNGITYSATVGAGGSWSVNIPAADAQALAQGNVPFTVSSTDIAGNPAQLNDSLTVDTEVTLTVNPVAGDDIINAAEAGAGVAVSGTANPADAGLTVTIVLNGVIYSATVQANGTWATTIPAANLAALSDGAYTLNAILTDAAGNSTTVPHTVTLDAAAALPTLTINAVSTDNYINGNEISQPLILSGNTTNVETGRIVTLSFSGNPLTAVVGANGAWSVEVPASIVSALTPGVHLVMGLVSDASGNQSNATGGFIVDLTADLTINPVATDDIINAAEAGAGVIVSGTAGILDAGRVVNISLNGKTYTATVQSNGSWSATLAAADLTALADGPYTLNASLTDAAGNSISVPRTITLDATVALAINTVATNDIVNATERDAGITISGTASPADAGLTVTVDVGGVDYPAVVQPDGSWSVGVAGQDLRLLADGLWQFTAALTDAVGNSITVSRDVEIDTHASLNIDAIAADNIINATEAQAGITISGTGETKDVGSPITLLLNGVTYTTTLQADGTWRIELPSSVLLALPDGAYQVTVDLTDNQGNTGEVQPNLIVDKTVTLTVDPVASDDIINAAEAGSDVAITGTADSADVGRTVTVSLGSFVYTATVQSDGSWSATLPSTDLATLADGSYTLNASLTDVVGNSISVPHSFTLDAAAATLPTLLINAASDDNYINAIEANQPLAVTGIAFNVEEGQTVTLSLNSNTYTATVGAAGVWSTVIPADVIAALDDGVYTLVGSVSDASGNAVDAGGGFTVDTQITLAIDPIASDDLINQAESLADVTVSGSASPVDEGGEVVVTLNGQSWTATIQGDGSWSTIIPAASLNALADGTYPLQASLTDEAGNSISPARNVTIDRTAAAPAIESVSALAQEDWQAEALPTSESDQAITPQNPGYSIGGMSVIQADGASTAAGADDAVFMPDEPQTAAQRYGFSLLGLESATEESGAIAPGGDSAQEESQSPTFSASQGESVTLLNAPEGMWDFSSQRTVDVQLTDVWHNGALSNGDPLGDALLEQNMHVRVQ
ncbi:Ig-like domain-containing protein [Franconibacter sp. IITDAS19]|uniref:Ig-like domain-containing protein n=1 Tax=Franconibacter sp. IITDAS19 TaxID=2930569 RepID=UPI001FFB7C61|nr:Ig-like domain-containing protein [Franconibacter sp. IITDAS19]MCK1970399.1 Ig-like domain-containing protein [Franconibacter sp. IITDAS19]